jgi:hypothetical protein
MTIIPSHMMLYTSAVETALLKNILSQLTRNLTKLMTWKRFAGWMQNSAHPKYEGEQWQDNMSQKQ